MQREDLFWTRIKYIPCIKFHIFEAWKNFPEISYGSIYLNFVLFCFIMCYQCPFHARHTGHIYKVMYMEPFKNYFIGSLRIKKQANFMCWQNVPAMIGPRGG